MPSAEFWDLRRNSGGVAADLDPGAGGDVASTLVLCREVSHLDEGNAP